MSDKALPLDLLLAPHEPEAWTGPELDYIGMPVGGCFAGTVYVGGDGQLWNWDIFNQEHEGSPPQDTVVFLGDPLRVRDGANYVRPHRQTSPFSQRWSLFLSHEAEAGPDNDWVPRTSSAVKFAESTFRGEYPVARVSLRRADAPVEADLEVFSPFIPLAVEDSSFPATTLTFRVKSLSGRKEKARLLYRFQNPCLCLTPTLHESCPPEMASHPEGVAVTRKAEAEASQRGDFGEFAASFSRACRVVERDGAYEIQCDFELLPGEEQEVTLFIAWRFPNAPKSVPGKTHWHAKRWSSAWEVIRELKERWGSLREATLLWNKTWYEGSLPKWLLDRTFLNLCILATRTCYRLDEGRYYFMEGVGCCPGTCTHVWGYAQGIAYVFPEVERRLRTEVDYGLAFHSDTGAIDYRGEYHRAVAHDGQASCVLRFYREHLMSRNDSLLREHWPKVKKSLEFLMAEDKDQDGLLEGAQYNTLDAAWHGPMAWISSLYIAALRAGKAMADLMGDEDFSASCQNLGDKGSKHLVTELYNGEYFIHKPDPSHPESNSTNDGCHIDQLYGQFWASQLGLPRAAPEAESRSAMAALFRHSFFPDIWEHRRKRSEIKGGRWYAAPGEGGLIMCTFPRGGSEKATGKGSEAWAAGYFNECMSGFEYQAAAGMIREGLVAEGLTVVKAIHDRYHPSRRNPYNEIECSDHYGRALAAFGVYLSVTGLRVDGPRGVVSLPRNSPPGAKHAFIAPDGWGLASTGPDGKTMLEYRWRVQS